MAGAALAAVVASLAVLLGDEEGGDRSSARGGEATSAESRESGARGGAPRERGDRGDRPRLPPPPIRMSSDDAAAPSPSAPLSQFTEEERDPGWADDKEELIRGVLEPLRREGVEVAGVECRARHCRIAVRGSEPEAFRSFLESMQDDRGFLGVADALMLSGLTRGEGGARSVDVYLRFDDG